MSNKEIIEELNQIGFYIYSIKNNDPFLKVLETRVQSLIKKLKYEA
jgi:hypothetical protein